MRLKPLALLLVPALGLTLACSPEKDDTSSGKKASAESCTIAKLPLKTKGQLTVGTDTPAYDPWFADNDPSNGKGFESAVAYAVAAELGFGKDQVKWVKVPFNNSYAPGDKTFDFDINQISISADRKKAVDFSEGYYSAAQAVVVLDKEGVKATTTDDLKSLKLGAQTGTTSLTAIRQQIQPKSTPVVFRNTNDAKQALLNGQVDGIVADLPTAFYITAAEIKGSKILGQFQPEAGQQEEFGLLLQKGSGLTPCVDKAMSTLKKNGKLAGLEKQWLSQSVDVPVLEK